MTREVESGKVADVRHHVARVRKLIPKDRSGLRADHAETEALILNLYLALQACTDLAVHVVAERGLQVPGDARAAYRVLAKAGLVEDEFASRLAAAVDLRDSIEYDRLDLRLVYEAARDGLPDLEAFAALAGNLLASDAE